MGRKVLKYVEISFSHAFDRQDSREEANDNVRFLKTLEPYVNSLLSESIDFEARPINFLMNMNILVDVCMIACKAAISICFHMF